MKSFESVVNMEEVKKLRNNNKVEYVKSHSSKTFSTREFEWRHKINEIEVKVEDTIINTGYNKTMVHNTGGLNIVKYI